MNSEKLENLIKKANSLIAACESFPDNKLFFEMKTRLGNAIDFCRNKNFAQPLVVSLIGGTGTGKSFIFSKLFGQQSISPSSDSVRGYTKSLFVSASENDRPFLEFDENTNFLPGILEGAVLVDSPDIDSIQEENLSLTKKLIEMSDLLIYVTTPDKRSNFDINQTLLDWASRKRWLFVMNKIDTAQDTSQETLKKDFCSKIEDLGFKNPETNTFLFSAREENSFEFNRFKNLIFSNRNFTQNSLIKEAACLRSFQFALSESPTLSKISQALQQTLDLSSKLDLRLKEAQKNVLKENELDKLADVARSSEVFHQIANRRTLFMFPYIMIANYMKSGVSAGDLAYSFTRRLKESISYNSCIKDEIRVIEDLSLRVAQTRVPTTQLNEAFPVQELRNNITESARMVANSKTITLYLFLANMLPFFILSQALFRAFSSWITGVWLPSDFFLHATMLVAGSTIPGYLLFSKGATRLSEKLDLSAFSTSLQSEKLNLAKQELSTYLQQSSEFGEQLGVAIKLTEKEIDPNYAGITIKSKL